MPGWLPGLLQTLLRRGSSLLQIESDLGLPAFADADAAAAHARELTRLYAASQHLSSGLDERERGPADELPVLAVTALVAARKLDPARGPLHLLRVRHSSDLTVAPE